jgi:LysM repeat protein
MIAGGMTGWRNPARYLAPLAIAAVAVASYTIVHRALIHKHKSASLSIVQSNTTTGTTTRTGHKASKAKFYFVKPNDTLSRIAAKTGVSLSTLENLNPNVTPDSLHPQQRLRLRR